MLKPSDLSKQQNQAYRDMLTKKSMCISSDCGFGKTISGLTAFVVLLKKHKGSKMLVVCNKEGVEKTWSQEHKKWSHTKHLKVTALVGTPAKRKKLLKQDSDVFAVTYNNLKWLLENNKGLNSHSFDFVFADEADCLKGGNSKWREYLIECAPNVKYKILSSATPKTAKEDDYWGLCHYMDGGKSLLATTFDEFKMKYCVSFPVNNRQIWEINKKMIKDLERRIQHLFFNYDLSEKSKIPIKTITCHANLSKESLDKYETLQNEQCINSVVYNDEGYKDEDESLDAVTLSGKLAQLSNGFLYMDDNVRISSDMLAKCTDVEALVRNSKKKTAVDVFDDRIMAFKKMINLIHERHGENQCIAIPYWYTHDLVNLKKAFPDGVSDKESDFSERWNKKEIPYLFLQYSRSSKSLNLQHGGNIMAFYSPTWKWVDDYQIIRRLARQGQLSDKVYAYRLYMRNTIDEEKTKRLNEKFRGHSRFQKKIIARCLRS